MSFSPFSSFSSFSCQAAVGLVKQGVEWEIAFFDFVDSFRREANGANKAILLDAPDTTGDIRLDALLRSMVMYLCDEAGIAIPAWASERLWLPTPWFVCGLSRLYSFSLVETPIRFKQNNIFVLSNFMNRV
jgi:hypothetical protein